MIDKELILTCTDNGKKVQCHVLAFKEQSFIDVSVNTVRIKLLYNKGTYAGSLGGYEFSIKESQLPNTGKEYRR
jgi:hypothetical protein